MTNEISLQSVDLPVRIGVYEHLASGGMGDVYLARDADFNQVASKCFHAAGRKRFKKVRARFDSECQIVVSISHPSLVAVVDHGEDARRQFLAVELVNGPNLRELLDGGELIPRKRAGFLVSTSVGRRSQTRPTTSTRRGLACGLCVRCELPTQLTKDDAGHHGR